MDESIIIPITVDKTSGLNELKQFSSEARKTITGIGRPLRFGEIGLDVKVNTAPAVYQFKNLGWGAKQAAADLGRVAPAANSANYAMLNLNRVVQDSPYGFMGISNNLNPLLESFQRLRTEAGSTGGAMRAMTRSLIGGGGLGLAVAAVGAALTFGAIGFQMWQGRANKAKTEVSAAAASQKQYAEEISQSAARLASLVGITQSSTASVNDKKNAIKAINQEYEGYLGNLGKEGATLKNVANAYDTVIDAMVRQAVVKGLQEQIAKEVEKTAQQMIKLSEAEEKRKMAIAAKSDKDKNVITDQQRMTLGLQQYNAAQRDGTIAQVHANQALMANVGNYATYEKRLEAAKDQLKDTLKPLMNLTDKFDDLGIKLKDHKDKVDKGDKAAKEFAAAQKDLAIQTQFLNDQLAKGLITELEFVEQKYKLISKASRDFQTSFGQAPDSSIIKELDGQLAVLSNSLARTKIQYASWVQEMQKAGSTAWNMSLNLEPGIDANSKGANRQAAGMKHKAELLQEGMELGIKSFVWKKQKIPFNAELDAKQMDAAISQARSQIAVFNSLINQAIVDGLSAVGQGLGDAMSGVDGLGGIFGKVGLVLGNAMIQFGQAIIKAGVTMEAAKKALAYFSSHPAVAIAAGISLIAMGTAFKNSMQKRADQRVTGFADGGLAFSPMLAMVGESSRTSRNNPEAFARFDQFASLINGEFRNMLDRRPMQIGSGQTTAVLEGDVVFQVSGDNLIGVLRRGESRQRRSY